MRGRLCIGGSLIGSIKETQEMLDYCGEKSITCDVEVPTPQQYLNTTHYRIESLGTGSHTVLHGGCHTIPENVLGIVSGKTQPLTTGS